MERANESGSCVKNEVSDSSPFSEYQYWFWSPEALPIPESYLYTTPASVFSSHISFSSVDFSDGVANYGGASLVNGFE